MDATGTERRALVGALGAARGVALLPGRRAPRARRRHRRVHRPACRSPRRPERRAARASTTRSSDRRAGRSTTATTGGATSAGFLEFFFAQMFTEPHSTKQIEDAVGVGPRDDAGDVLAASVVAASRCRRGRRARLCARVRCPVLVDPGRPRTRSAGPERGAPLAEATGARARHARGRPGTCRTPRDPVAVNLLLRDFVAPAAAAPRAGRAPRRAPRRALYVSSPIGLGHARRDVAIADELRRLHPGSRDRLARPASGDRACSRPAASASTRPAPTSPASRRTSTSEAGEHELHCFQAIRRMDEILLRELHGLPRRRARRALRPVDRRRGLGARLLPAREPRAQARALRVADRLRRLAADARGRRARGVPDRRLQRAR